MQNENSTARRARRRAIGHVLGAGAGLLCGFINSSALARTSAARSAFPRSATDDQPFRLHHVTLFARDEERASAWYVRHLGFEIIDRAVLQRQDGVRFDSIRVGIGGLWINISRVSGLTMREPALTYNGWRQISLAVVDVPSVWQRLREEGVEVLGQGVVVFDVQGSRFGPHRFRAGFVRDPEGNVVELYEDHS